MRIMDIKPTKYKKGDMVRLDAAPSSTTLGIVKGQDGLNVEVQWIIWPTGRGHPIGVALTGAWPMYKLRKVENPD